MAANPERPSQKTGDSRQLAASNSPTAATVSSRGFKIYLAAALLLLHGLDDADGHGLAHVAHGEAAQRRVLGEGLHAHGLGRNHLHVRGVTWHQQQIDRVKQNPQL